jgi:hypothetical protein
MLQAFRDHYGDAIETQGEQTARFWLQVVGDEGKSLLREHIAAFAERIWFMKMLLVTPTLELWQRRQTRRLALVTQLCLIAAVLLVWTPLLVGRVLLVTSRLGLVPSNSGSVSYYLSTEVERPTNQFVSAFMQATADIAADDLHAYHFSSSRVEISTLALALAAVGASAAPTPAFLLAPRRHRGGRPGGVPEAGHGLAGGAPAVAARRAARPRGQPPTRRRRIGDAGARAGRACAPGRGTACDAGGPFCRRGAAARTRAARG